MTLAARVGSSRGGRHRTNFDQYFVDYVDLVTRGQRFESKGTEITMKHEYVHQLAS